LFAPKLGVAGTAAGGAAARTVPKLFQEMREDDCVQIFRVTESPICPIPHMALYLQADEAGAASIIFPAPSGQETLF